jgi:hypothetical protein
MKAQAAGEPVSPADFSHSVHNATAGLYSIAAGNRAPGTSLSARDEGFAGALLEAGGFLAEGHPRALLVMSDPDIPDVFRGAWKEEPSGYAFGLLLGSSGGEEWEFSLRSSSGEDARAADSHWPLGLAFLRTLAGGMSAGGWRRGARRWEWTRR